MSRKRHHNHQRPRQQPGSERSYLAYQIDLPAQNISRTELVRLIRGGEDTHLELKVRFSNVEKLTAEVIALANTEGGAIIFGVNDQLRIEGVDDVEEVEEQLRELCAREIQPPVFPYLNKVAFDSGRRIVVLEVENGNRPHRTLDDRYYIREGATKREASREEISTIYRESHVVGFEQAPVFQAQFDGDIDESLFWSYVRGVNPGYWEESSRGFPTDTVLREMGLATKVGETLLPTMGGMLLFGWDESLRRLLPNADVRLTRLSGNAPTAPVVEQVHLQGNLLRLFDGSIHFIKRYVDLWDARPSRKVREGGDANDEAGIVPGRAHYHRGAILEALTNFLAHRDWSAREARARINIYDDCIEFINPSRQLELPIASLRYGVAIPPNPRLKAIFTNPHYGLPSPHGGIPMLFAESINVARRAPDGPSITNHEFRLKIHGLR
ncbi:MAG: putative DNA binding domain-containing protein [Blastocatellia bacterium]|nr:putative DNA binding domain-containing protein [Blastocatellia bacterium]